MKRILCLFGLMCICCQCLLAQELQIEPLEKLERDLYARTHERLDLNEVPCAVIRVSVANAKDFTFEGNIIGDVIYHPGEALVYMTKGSRNVTIKSEKFGAMKYAFPERLEKQVVYRLKLKIILPEDQKTRTLVMPVVGLGEATSYGVMIGLVKKTGAYLKVKYNFQSLSNDYECDANGVVVGSNEPSWFTGENKTTRFALTAGVLQRLYKPLYLYAGAGYGTKILGWEMQGGEWAENVDESYKGIEAELGGIYRIKNIALSAGVQTNSFKYWEATLGVGIMF